MAQKINWTQIDTNKIPKKSDGSPYPIILGNQNYEEYLEAVYSKVFSGDLLSVDKVDLVENPDMSGFTQVIKWNPLTKEITFGDADGHSHNNLDVLDGLDTNNDGDMTYNGEVVLTPTNVNDFVLSDKNFVHDQFSPANVWIISHNLNKKVAPIITDTAGTIVEGRITINDGNTVVVEFNFPFSGEAILN